MKKKGKAPIFPSAQWMSQSSLGGAADLAANSARSRPGNGSGSPEDCSRCHIDFTKNEVAVAWDGAPKNTYAASRNLKKSGWKPDWWTISSTAPDATIDPSGKVTFGPKGQTVTITAGVARCPNCMSSFTLHIIQLSIEYADPNDPDPWTMNDVTNQETDIEVGNYIALKATVLPAALAPANGKYQWVIPKNKLKDYREGAASDPVVPLPAADLKNAGLSFHWLDGGAKKVTVSTKIKGVEVSAKTTFNVSRPNVTIKGAAFAQPAAPQNGILNPPPPEKPEPNAWILDAGTMGCTSNLPAVPPPGKFVWVQMLNLYVNSQIVGGQRTDLPPVGQRSGLDDGFPYSRDQDTATDQPTTTYHTNIESWAERRMECTMFFMYLSAQDKSRYVPLRAFNWKVNSSAKAGKNGIFPNLPNYKQEPASKLTVDPNDRDVTGPPNWKRIIKTAH